MPSDSSTKSKQKACSDFAHLSFPSDYVGSVIQIESLILELERHDSILNHLLGRLCETSLRRLD